MHCCWWTTLRNSRNSYCFSAILGSEVAEYTAKHLAEVIRSTPTYKGGDLKQCLVDAFLKIDKDFTKEEVCVNVKGVFVISTTKSVC